jgi:MFS family permease
VREASDQVARKLSIFAHWRGFGREARLYLLHAGLLTTGLAVTSLFFNLAILALGFERSFLGVLNVVSVATAVALSLPLWWLATRMGLRRALVVAGACQAFSALTLALVPTVPALLLAAAATGLAAVLFQITAAPFMMRHSDEASRDALFSANAALNIGLAGVGSLLGGYLPGLLGVLFVLPPESASAYRASFGLAGLVLLIALVPLARMRPHPSAPRDLRLPDEPARAMLVPAQPLAHASFRRSWRLPEGILRRVPEPWRGLVARPWPLLRLLIPPALISLGAALLIPYLNLFFRERFTSPDATLGLIFAAIGIATGLAALAAPLLSARLGKIPTIVLAQLLSIPFLLLLGFAPLLWLAVGAALLRGALFNLGAPLYDAFAMEQSAEAARPTVIGLINAAYAAGYLVAPPLSVWVQERYGFAPLFVATALCYAAAALATFLFFGRHTARA